MKMITGDITVIGLGFRNTYSSDFRNMMNGWLERNQLSNKYSFAVDGRDVPYEDVFGDDSEGFYFDDPADWGYSYVRLNDADDREDAIVFLIGCDSETTLPLNVDFTPDVLIDLIESISNFDGPGSFEGISIAIESETGNPRDTKYINLLENFDVNAPRSKKLIEALRNL